MKKAGAQKPAAGKKYMEPAEIKKIFAKLANGKQTIDQEALFQFFGKDLGLAADDPLFGYLTTIVMGIDQIQNTTYENFEALIKYAKIQNLQDLKDKIKNREFHNDFASQNTYKTMYKKIFQLYADRASTLGNQKNLLPLSLDVAAALWEVYLKGKLVSYNQFMAYVKTLPENTKIYKDLWNMMIEFAYQVKNLDQDYKDEDGWPIFLDKYVEHLRNHSN